MLAHFTASTKDFSNPQNSYAKTFIYDREDLVMEIQDQKVKAFYVHAPGIDNPIAVLRDLNNNQEFDDDEVFFYTKDHLGSIRELVGLDGKLKQRQRYTAYGVTTREKNTDEMDRLIDHAYGFTGRELDSETGFYFYRSRYYSAEMQRFVSEDSIGYAGGEAILYGYVGNNPLSFVDPFGLFCLNNFFNRASSNFSTTTSFLGLSFTSAIGDLAGIPLLGGALIDFFSNGKLTGVPGGTISSGVAAFGTFTKSGKTRSLSRIFSVALKQGGRSSISTVARRVALRTALAANAAAVAAGYASLTFGVAIGSAADALYNELNQTETNCGKGCN